MKVLLSWLGVNQKEGYPGWFWLNQESPLKKGLRDFPGGAGVKNPPSNAGDKGLIPGGGTKIPN